MGLIYTMRGLSALSVSTIRAMREPRHVGWAKANPTLYFCGGKISINVNPILGFGRNEDYNYSIWGKFLTI